MTGLANLLSDIVSINSVNPDLVHGGAQALQRHPHRPRERRRLTSIERAFQSQRLIGEHTGNRRALQQVNNILIQRFVDD